ncbi:hypothetical protein WJX73_009594 [Symbiochloris irregularis]|uniref:Uncharacterized protein n=1 Tax=Symbiochloris irregularis TaxID=706552 RepID=A0AAW1P099_9CHLO
MNPSGPLPRVNLSWHTASGEKMTGTYVLQLAGEPQQGCHSKGFTASPKGRNHADSSVPSKRDVAAKALNCILQSTDGNTAQHGPLAQAQPLSHQQDCQQQTPLEVPSATKHWTPNEDALLKQLVQQHGPRMWNSLAKNLHGRHGKQLRERWLNHLDPAVKHGAWTQKENLILVQKQAELGNHWSQIRRFLPGRPDNAIKNHWWAHLKRQVEAVQAAGNMPQLLQLAAHQAQMQEQEMGARQHSPDSLLAMTTGHLQTAHPGYPGGAFGPWGMAPPGASQQPFHNAAMQPVPSSMQPPMPGFGSAQLGIGRSVAPPMHWPGASLPPGLPEMQASSVQPGLMAPPTVQKL